MGKYLVGTRFYVYPDDSDLPLVIRLKKESVNELSFVCGGTIECLSQSQVENMDLSYTWDIGGKNEYGDIFYRHVHIAGIDFHQKWTPISDDTGLYVLYEIEKVHCSITVRNLEENFIKLNPDGFITVSNIFYKTDADPNGFDVLVTLHVGNDRTPFAICRQDVVDIYNYRTDGAAIPIGTSISRATCPKNIDLMSFMYSEKVKDFKASAFYIDDDLRSMMKYIGSLNRYNATIHKLHDKYEGTQMRGCSNNLFELLEDKHFIGEFKIANKLRTWPFYIDLDNDELSPEMVDEFNKLCRTNAKAVEYLPYSRELDINALGDKCRIATCIAGEGKQCLMAFIFK